MTEGSDNPFDSFNEIAPILPFIHSTYGEAALRELLSNVEIDQESLSREAAELADMGLEDVASIVQEFADKAPTYAELYCPYSPEDRCNYESWHRSRSALAPKADVKQRA